MKTILVALTLLLPAFGQEYRGTILGRAIDASGLAVAGARIHVINENTGAASATETNESGLYQIPFLLPGTYTLYAEKSGFKRIGRPSLRVLLNAGLTVDLVFEIGAVAETVTVTATPPLLNMSGSDLGQVVDSRYVAQLAVALTRNSVAAARLAPGVTGKIGTFSSNDQAEISLSGGGSTQARNEFLLDGIPNTVPQGGGNIVFVPSLDTVEEVKVHTTMFDASYGHSNGGAVSLTTRGGGNELHGTAYLYKRWAALDANSWVNNRLGLGKPPVSYNQWGFTAGGPVLLPKLYNGRNKTFFFVSREKDRLANALSRQSRVPTDAERQGDFSQTLARIGGPLTLYDPATTQVSAGRATRQPFAGSRIPASRLDPTGAAVLKAFPQPNFSEAPLQVGRFNWGGTGVSDTSNYNTNVRIDHQFGERNRLFGRFSRLVRDQSAVEFFRGPTEFPIDGNAGIADIYRKFHSLALDDTFVFSPRFTGSLRYGYSRRSQETQRGGYGQDGADLAVSQGVLANQAFKGYPVFRLGENTATIGSFFSLEATEVHTLLATFNRFQGRHGLKFGIDWRVARWNRLVPGNAGPGDFTVTAIFTQQDPFNNASADRTGTSLASLLLGAPLSGNIGSTSPLSMQNHYVAGFLQEDWKVTPKLTLNAGLRYELEFPYTERYNRISRGFDYDAAFPSAVPGLALRGGLLFAGADGAARRGGPVDRNNFGPRFGLAWQFLPRTVLRAGYGLFYAAQTYNSSFLGEVDTFTAITPYVGSLDGGATAATTLRNPFPQGVQRPLGSAPGLEAQFGNALTFYNPARVNPYNQQWQFSVKHELPWQVLLDAAYLGMSSLKQFEAFDLNEKPDRFLALGTAENTRVPNPFFGVAPASSTLGQGTTIIQRRLWPAYPQYTALTVQGANTGRAIYHSFQFKTEKRFSHGFSMLLTHAWSKLIDNNTTSIVNPRKYRSVSQFDQEHVFRLAATYQLPFRPANRFLRQAAGGWELSGFWTIETGVPLAVTHANGRPVRIRNPKLEGPVGERLGDRRDASGRVANPYFDIGAFAPLPNQFTISPEPAYFDELRAPTARSLNLSLFKNFRIRERVTFQLRMDAISITNTPVFDPPGTNLSNAATFGAITGAGGSRQMLGSARISF